MLIMRLMEKHEGTKDFGTSIDCWGKLLKASIKEEL